MSGLILTCSTTTVSAFGDLDIRIIQSSLALGEMGKATSSVRWLRLVEDIKSYSASILSPWDWNYADYGRPVSRILPKPAAGINN